MVESTTFIIEREFCAIIRKHLKPLVIERLASNMNLKGFKSIPYVFEATDDSHILILIVASLIDSAFNYC
jgi:hypothetical protein